MAAAIIGLAIVFFNLIFLYRKVDDTTFYIYTGIGLGFSIYSIMDDLGIGKSSSCKSDLLLKNG